MMKMNKGTCFTICSMGRAVDFMGCVFLLLVSGASWGQTPIREGKFTLADSTVFWVTDKENKSFYTVADIEGYPYILPYDTISVMAKFEKYYVNKCKVFSNPRLGDILWKTFRKKLSDWSPGKRVLSVFVNLNKTDLGIWTVSFLLLKENNDVSLEDLAAIRRAIYRDYRPEVDIHPTVDRDYFDYFSDYDAVYYD